MTQFTSVPTTEVKANKTHVNNKTDARASGGAAAAGALRTNSFLGPYKKRNFTTDTYAFFLK